MHRRPVLTHTFTDSQHRLIFGAGGSTESLRAHASELRGRSAIWLADGPRCGSTCSWTTLWHALPELGAQLLLGQLSEVEEDAQHEQSACDKGRGLGVSAVA